MVSVVKSLLKWIEIETSSGETADIDLYRPYLSSTSVSCPIQVLVQPILIKFQNISFKYRIFNSAIRLSRLS